MRKHEWERGALAQNRRYHFLCFRCGGQVQSQVRPTVLSRSGGFYVEVVETAHAGTRVIDPRQLSADCDLEIVRRVMES